MGEEQGRSGKDPVRCSSLAQTTPNTIRPVEPSPPSHTPHEPNLLPKLRFYLAEFPTPHYLVTPEAANLDYLMRITVRPGFHPTPHVEKPHTTRVSRVVQTTPGPAIRRTFSERLGGSPLEAIPHPPTLRYSFVKEKRGLSRVVWTTCLVMVSTRRRLRQSHPVTGF